MKVVEYLSSHFYFILFEKSECIQCFKNGHFLQKKPAFIIFCKTKRYTVWHYYIKYPNSSKLELGFFSAPNSCGKVACVEFWILFSLIRRNMQVTVLCPTKFIVSSRIWQSQERNPQAKTPLSMNEWWSGIPFIGEPSVT